MKFILQMIADMSVLARASSEEASVIDERVDAFNRQLAKAGAWVFAEGLQGPETAVTVRFEEDAAPLVGDGPFADRDEQLAGFWIVDVQTRDEAVEWARKLPMSSGAVEVRPLYAGQGNARSDSPEGV